MLRRVALPCRAGGMRSVIKIAAGSIIVGVLILACKLLAAHVSLFLEVRRILGKAVDDV